MLKVMIALTAVVALTACGGGGHTASTSSSTAGSPSTSSAPPSPSITPDARYGTIEQLRDAAIAAGYSCRHWRTTNKVTLAAESGSCSGADVFSTFASDGDLQAQLDSYKDTDKMLADAGIPPDPHLVGPNWIISSAAAPAVQPLLGGTIVAAHSN